MNVLSGKTGVLLFDRLRRADITNTDVTISAGDAGDLLELINAVSIWYCGGDDKPYVPGLAARFVALIK